VAAAAAMDLPTTEVNTWNNGGDLQPSGEWRRNLDLKAWGAEIRALEKELKEGQTVEDDVAHLKTIMTWSNICWWTGLVLCPFTMWSAVLMSTAVMARWTMVGHHVCHGGYNAQQSEGGKITGRFHRRSFALGFKKRMTDWLDWMKPEAWDVEHNNLHHYKLGETADPDLVERNLQNTVRAQKEKGVPNWLRVAQVVPLFFIWKWYYYAPNTLKELEKWEATKAENRGEKPADSNWGHLGENAASVLTTAEGLAQGKAGMFVDLAKCLLPYGLMMFAVIPGGVYALLGAGAAKTAFASVVIAELLTNFDSFAVIATTHAGADSYKFETRGKVKSDEFYLRAVIGSTNFHTGSDFGKPGGFVPNMVDFSQGWLNYQIEHHMWPDMSMLSYQKAAPRVRAICEKYGVPYVQEPVWVRVKKTVDIMTGERNMLNWDKGQ
jgi:fatty acid desaturase